jgi:DNA-binding LytR/AlgR family response regulator
LGALNLGESRRFAGILSFREHDVTAHRSRRTFHEVVVQLMSFVTIHVEKAVWEVVDPADVYLLEAEGDNTRVRILREYMVNLARVRRVRRREDARDWEVRMQPPVSRVLPVSREAWPELKRVLGGEVAR